VSTICTDDHGGVEMTKLVVLPEDDPGHPVVATTDPEEITSRLAANGVAFEQWEVRALAAGDDVLAAYAAEIDRLTASDGYVTVDVARLHPDASDPAWASKAAEARHKFLEEHTHADGEVRFFVEGRGAFYLRLDGGVHIVVCEAGDLISVPKETRHWFDMGTTPSFTAVRFFLEDEGWVGKFTGDPIASRFPTFDELVAPAAV
jgi:1,2-dihydroxy-3-keto-5-methylthiopentene dioxygenase